MNEFEELIKRKSDNELLALYVIRDEYKPEYVAFLLEEIVVRGLFKSKLGIDVPSELTEQEIVEAINCYISNEKIKGQAEQIEEEDIQWKRAINLIVDTAVLITILIIISLNTGIDEDSFMLLNIIVVFVYYLLLERMTGKTIGKYLTNTHVVTLDGKHPSLKKLIIRTLARLIPFDNISFLFHADWHDRISGTKVVSKTIKK